MKTTIAQTVSFGRDGNAGEFQTYGWHGPENGFNWTLGLESGLILPKFGCPHGLVVEMFFHPLVKESGPPVQRLSVALNGIDIGAEATTMSTIAGFVSPPPAPQDQRLVLAIRHPDAYATMPGHPHLALAMARIRLLRIEEAAPQSTLRFAPAITFDDPDQDPATLLRQARDVVGVDPLQIVSGFEMLAGNCEFGGIQRRFGAEPLSLLRFAGATVEAAIRGLDTEFDGIGLDLEATISPDATKEWMITDKGFGLRYHTFIPSDSVSMEEVIKKEKRKVSFLKRKFIEDLCDTNKIFIIVDRFRQPLGAALPPFLALNRHGRHPLLWVTEAGDDEIGSVREMLPGLFVSRIDRLAKHGYPHDASLHHWMSILLNTWLLVTAREAHR